jgi:hypothetical protein
VLICCTARIQCVCVNVKSVSLRWFNQALAHSRAASCFIITHARESDEECNEMNSYKACIYEEINEIN